MQSDEEALEAQGARLDHQLVEMREQSSSLRAAAQAARTKLEESVATRRSAGSAMKASIAGHSRERADAEREVVELTEQLGRAGAQSRSTAPSLTPLYQSIDRLDETVVGPDAADRRDRSVAGPLRPAQAADRRRPADQHLRADGGRAVGRAAAVGRGRRGGRGRTGLLTQPSPRRRGEGTGGEERRSERGGEARSERSGGGSEAGGAGLPSAPRPAERGEVDGRPRPAGEGSGAGRRFTRATRCRAARGATAPNRPETPGRRWA